MAHINNKILERLNTTDPEALSKLYNAMLDDLIERRKPRDIDLFKHYMTLRALDHESVPNAVRDFTEIARDAFSDYHAERAKGARLEEGKVVYPAAAPDDDDDADDDEECDIDTTADADEE